MSRIPFDNPFGGSKLRDYANDSPPPHAQFVGLRAEIPGRSKKGSPLSLSIGFYPGNPEPCVLAHNNSTKGVLTLVAVVNFKDAARQASPPLTTYQDYAFKFGIIKSHDQRNVAPIIMSHIKTLSVEGNASGVQHVVDPVEFKNMVGDGAVLVAQFEDGTTWGDFGVARRLLDSRPQKLAFLKRLVETYYESGEAAFEAVLHEPNPGRSPKRQVAACLKGDAADEKISTIDLAKKRLADAQGWHASGIF